MAVLGADWSKKYKILGWLMQNIPDFVEIGLGNTKIYAAASVTPVVTLPTIHQASAGPRPIAYSCSNFPMGIGARYSQSAVALVL